MAELLLADDGGENTGKFLLRLKDAATENYILSVIYKGQATHHQVINDGGWTVNKKPTEAADLGEVSLSAAAAGACTSRRRNHDSAHAHWAGHKHRA